MNGFFVCFALALMYVFLLAYFLQRRQPRERPGPLLSRSDLSDLLDDWLELNLCRIQCFL